MALYCINTTTLCSIEAQMLIAFVLWGCQLRKQQLQRHQPERAFWTSIIISQKELQLLRIFKDPVERACSPGRVEFSIDPQSVSFRILYQLLASPLQVVTASPLKV